MQSLVVTATLSFNVLPLTLATAMLNVPLKVTTARVSAYMLTLTFATATLSFNVLPLTLNVNVFPLKVATLTVSAYMLTLTFATV